MLRRGNEMVYLRRRRRTAHQRGGYVWTVRCKPTWRVWLSPPIFSSSVHGTLQSPYKLLAELPNTESSCSRHGVVAAWLPTERPGGVIPFSKIFTLLGVHYSFSHCGRLWNGYKTVVSFPCHHLAGLPTRWCLIYILSTFYDRHQVSFTGDIQPLQFTQQPGHSCLLLFLIAKPQSSRCLLCISPSKSLLAHSIPSQTKVYRTHSAHR